MKKLSISHTITPDGWMPKPNSTHYSFLDWLTNYTSWLVTVKKKNII